MKPISTMTRFITVASTGRLIDISEICIRLA
jgi:hypothetical protein